MAFISSSDREKSKICSFHKLFKIFLKSPLCVLFGEKAETTTYVKVVFDTMGAEALRDDHDASLNVEPQAHLGCALVVLFGDRCQKFVEQQRRALQVYPVSKKKNKLV